MYKYAIVESILDKKSFWIYQPWIAKNAVLFKTFDHVPKDHIVVAHYPCWLEPLKKWADKGMKFIEIEWGYWGERPTQGKARINTRRVSYCHSHNIKMKPTPYLRSNLLKPEIYPWKESRGDYLLLIEPNPEWVTKRTGLEFGEWKKKFLDTISSHWTGPIRWRQKRSGAKQGRFDSFKRDLEGCFAVVGERTMACAEAVMLGYPAYTIDDSIVTPLMGKDLRALSNPILPDRSQWADHVAWSQFFVNEFSQGTLVADLVENYQINP